MAGEEGPHDGPARRGSVQRVDGGGGDPSLLASHPSTPRWPAFVHLPARVGDPDHPVYAAPGLERLQGLESAHPEALQKQEGGGTGQGSSKWAVAMLPLQGWGAPRGEFGLPRQVVHSTVGVPAGPTAPLKQRSGGRQGATQTGEDGMPIDSPPAWTIRPAKPTDEAVLFALLPELASFPLPPRRMAEDLWSGDAALARKILAHKASASFLDVAVTNADEVVGLVMVSLRPELLSEAPSAHLEAIVVHPAHRGLGLGRHLMQHCEHRVRGLGATSMTLHVFDRNERAKRLYRAEGFDLEIIRAVKWLDGLDAGS